MLNVVITGVNGFVGKHLVKELAESDIRVSGIGRDSSADSSISHLLTNYVSADLREGWPDLEVTVDAVIHLAGLAAVGPSFDAPQRYLNDNSAMVTNMCEFYLKQDKKPRIIIVSSGAVYDATQTMPIGESGIVTFGSPYAVSKILNENQAAYYTSRGLECVVVRPFNHIGPNQSEGFIVPDLTQKIQNLGSSDGPIVAGNLLSRRDYTDVRDVARAYRLIATSKETPRELIYNVCSGESHSGEEVLAVATRSLGVPLPDVTVDEKLIRPNDAPDIRGDSTRLRSEFDWRPEHTFEQSINDFVRSTNKP